MEPRRGAPVDKMPDASLGDRRAGGRGRAGRRRGGAWWYLRPEARPDPVAAAYLEAWGRQDWPAMQAQVAAPPADFARQHTDMVEDLRVTEAGFARDGHRHRRPGRGVPFQARLRLRALGEWTYQGCVPARRPLAGRLVAGHPPPGPDRRLRFQRTRTWPDRAPILAADGSELAGPGPVVTISIVGEGVKDPAEVVDALATHLEVPRAAARRHLADAARRPNQAVPVVTVPEVDYQAVGRHPPRARPAVHRGGGPGTTARPRPGCCSARSTR